MFNLIELIASVLLLLSMVALPYVEVIKNTAYSGLSAKLPFGYGIYTFFDYLRVGEIQLIIRTFFILLVVVNVIICAVSAFGKSYKKDTAAHVVLPTILSIAGILFCIVGPLYDTSFIAVPNTLFNIIFLVLLAVIAVFAFLKRSQFAFPKGHAPIPVEKDASLSNATDELKRYKELLDSGVISEKEFNKKKKQLMGL